jgi:hypothetical protein
MEQNKNIHLGMLTVICISIIVIVLIILGVMWYNNQNKPNIKIGEYRISYNVNFPTQESKEEIGMYYDYLAVEFKENQKIRIFFSESYYVEGQYEIDKNKIVAKSLTIKSEWNEEKAIDTQFVFEIMDQDNIKLLEIKDPDYVYGIFIDTENVPGNIYTYIANKE